MRCISLITNSMHHSLFSWFATILLYSFAFAFAFAFAGLSLVRLFVYLRPPAKASIVLCGMWNMQRPVSSCLPFLSALQVKRVNVASFLWCTVLTTKELQQKWETKQQQQQQKQKQQQNQQVQVKSSRQENKCKWHSPMDYSKNKHNNNNNNVNKYDCITTATNTLI